MKKLITVCALFIFAITGKVSAQQFIARLTTTGLKEGTNTVVINKLKGTLQFVKKGDSYSDVIFTDNKGNISKLATAAPGSNGTVQPECKGSSQACFGTGDKRITAYFCVPAATAGSQTRQTSIVVDLIDDKPEATPRLRRAEIKISY